MSDTPPGPGHNGISPAMFLEFYGQIRKEKRKVDEATAGYRNARKRAETAGVNLKALAFMEKLAKMDDDEAASHLRTSMRYASWADLKISQQPDLLEPGDIAVPEKAMAEHRESIAEDAGYAAGRQGADRSENPYPPGSPFAAKWDQGWGDGQRVIAMEMGPDGSGAKKVKGKKGRGAEMGPG
jgi:hypothetical protein